MLYNSDIASLHKVQGTKDASEALHSPDIGFMTIIKMQHTSKKVW